MFYKQLVHFQVFQSTWQTVNSTNIADDNTIAKMLDSYQRQYNTSVRALLNGRVIDMRN